MKKCIRINEPNGSLRHTVSGLAGAASHHRAQSGQQHGVGLGLGYGCDLDGAIHTTAGVLNVHVGLVRVELVEVQTGELGAWGTIRSPATDAFAVVEQVAILVDVPGESDIIILAAVTVLVDVDVAFGIDGQIVGATQGAADRQATEPVIAGPLLPSNWPPAPTRATKVWPAEKYWSPLMALGLADTYL